MAVLVIKKESGSHAYMAQITQHLQSLSDDTKEDIKLIGVSTILDDDGALESYTNAAGRICSV